MKRRADELTSVLHLESKEARGLATGALEEYISTLAELDRKVVREIESGNGEKAMILIYRGTSKGGRFLITEEQTSIGRSPSSAIFLDDVTVSRLHATIEREGAGFLLRDSVSLNGTYLNNKPVTQAHLRTGDEIQIGRFHLLFVTGQQVKREN